MQTFPKKKIIILLIAEIIYALNFLVIAQLQASFLSSTGTISSGWLSFWKVVAIIEVGYACVWLWTRPFKLLKRYSSLPPRKNSFIRRVSPDTRVLLLCFCFLISPDLYGRILFLMGMPIYEFYFFAGVSLAMTLAWSIYNLRINPTL
jgi:hypothetical protein